MIPLNHYKYDYTTTGDKLTLVLLGFIIGFVTALCIIIF